MDKTGLNKKKIAIAFILVSGVLFGAVVGAFFALSHDLPQIRSLETFTPSAVTRIYSSDRVLLAELFVEKRDPVPLTSIPAYLKAALVATEDRKFYSHSGVDLKGILRAIIRDIRAGEFVEGASTITQQLSKTLFLTPQKTLVRKIKEAMLAFQLERRYTKNEILEFYLNQVYFGSGAYGVESAARLFFGKSVKDLDLAECATIAGMPKAPSRYSPLVNSELAIKRRNTVLKQMCDTGIITASAFQQTLKKGLNLKSQNKNSTKAPYFVDYVKKFLEKELGSSILYRGGLSVFATLSFDLQQAAEVAVANGLGALETRMKPKGHENPLPQCALVSLDVRSGGILAMVGGRNFYDSPFNRATIARRQPGSAFKPIVYACAIERGFAQNMMILDAPIVFKGALNGKDWRPKNFSGTYLGAITLRKALTTSKNIPAVRLIEMIGPSSVSQFASSLGIESPLSPNLSLALGTSDVTLMDLTSAYAVFPNRGKRIKPYGVMEVRDRKGKLIWRIRPNQSTPMSREGAAIMTNMLQGVVKEGTGRKARIIKRPIAGKTGTTDAFKDALFVGFSPSIATGVWVCQDISMTLGKGETGAKAALPIWIAYMTAALAKRPYAYFDIPDDVVRLYMDPSTGKLDNNSSSHAVAAFFKKDTEPGQY
jgi:penicillin-binding protein 1A